MRGDADRRLGRGQADGGAHRTRQPRAGLGRRRPDGLDQAAEHHDVDGLQPRLQRPPDEDARMLGAAATAQRATAAHHLALKQRIEQTGHHVAALVRQVGQRGQRGGQQRGEGLAFLLGPQPDGAMASHPVAARFSAAAINAPTARPPGRSRRWPERADAGSRQASTRLRKAFRSSPDTRDRAAQAGKARHRPRTAQAPRSPARAPLAAGGRGQAGGGERMLQQRQQRDRREVIGHRARQQAQEHGGRRFGQGLARAVVGDDAVTRQRGGHPPGQFAVRRDQRGGAARRFHRLRAGSSRSPRLLPARRAD